MARTPILPEATPGGALTANCGVHGRDSQCPIDVDSSRPLSAITRPSLFAPRWQMPVVTRVYGRPLSIPSQSRMFGASGRYRRSGPAHERGDAISYSENRRHLLRRASQHEVDPGFALEPRQKFLIALGRLRDDLFVRLLWRALSRGSVSGPTR
jgi:hypothetical protein